MDRRKEGREGKKAQMKDLFINYFLKDIAQSTAQGHQGEEGSLSLKFQRGGIGGIRQAGTASDELGKQTRQTDRQTDPPASS